MTQAVSDDSGWRLSRLLLDAMSQLWGRRGCRWDVDVSFGVIFCVEIPGEQLEVASLQLDRLMAPVT